MAYFLDKTAASCYYATISDIRFRSFWRLSRSATPVSSFRFKRRPAASNPSRSWLFARFDYVAATTNGSPGLRCLKTRCAMNVPRICNQLGRLFVAALASILLYQPPANAATTYLYDLVGRLTVIRYDNGVCVAYSYDANGDRTSSSTALNATGSLKWGASSWGCKIWSSN
jgi:YD repeat-containing protein